MPNFFSFVSKKKIPNLRTLARELQRFTFVSILFFIIAASVLTTVYLILWQLSVSQTKIVPARGGTLVEGVIGAPHFLNPLLAVTTTDTHLVSMLYSGVVKKNNDGTVAPELGTYSVSPDGMTYTFTLKPNIRFSDGSPVTSEDVLFTYTLLQNGLGGTALQKDWQPRTITQQDLRTLTITIPTGDSKLLDEATIGILPKKYWGTISGEAFPDTPNNIRPIGTGPFKVDSVEYENGVPTIIQLQKNRYALEKPYIDHYSIETFPNQNDLASALSAKEIDFTTALPADALNGVTFSHYTVSAIPTEESVLIAATVNNSVLSDERIRTYLESVIDKEALIATIENGYGLTQDQINSLESTQAQNDAKSALFSQPNSQKDFSLSPQGMLLKQGTPIRLLVVVESNSKEALVAHYIAAKLNDAGIETEVRSFDAGTYLDLVTNHSAPAIITTSNQLPEGYGIQIPLYTRTTPVIINTKMNALLSESNAAHFSNLYTTTPLWHIRWEHIWKWFI